MNDRTFLIDSDNLRSVRSALYGYMVSDEGELSLDQIPPRITEAGAYALVEADGDVITVLQDLCGAFGLFLYRRGSRFLLSNSFFRLAEALKGELTLNREHARALVYADYEPWSTGGTLANEITKLPASARIVIDTKTGELEIRHKTYTYFADDLRSAEDFERLDRWFNKWVKVFRQVARSGACVSADLSGGFDTRIILAMLRYGRIDLGGIRISSHDRVGVPKDRDDFRIAGEIASALGFSLNQTPYEIKKSDDAITPEEAYEVEKALVFGDSLVTQYPWEAYKEPFFLLKGFGSTVKGSSWFRPATVMARRLLFSFFGRRPAAGPRDGLRKMSEGRELLRYYLKVRREILGAVPYRDHRATLIFHHRLSTEKMDMHKLTSWMAANRVVLSPFLDPEIVRLNCQLGGRDRQALAMLILDRYAPELLEFELQGRKLKSGTLRRVRELNRRYPAKEAACEPVICQPRPNEIMTVDRERFTSYMKAKWEAADFSETVSRGAERSAVARILEIADPKKLNSGSQPVNALLALYEFMRLCEKKP